MKFRTIVLSVATIAALAGSARSTESRRSGPFAKWIYDNPVPNQPDVCMTNAIATNEPICSNALTGPVCTVTPGVLPTRTAYDQILNCVLPLRQP